MTIRIAHVLNGLTHEEAYLRGWQDHVDSLELAEDAEAALSASMAHQRLDGMLDRIWQIAPYEIEPALGPEPAASGQGEPFDWAAAA